MQEQWSYLLEKNIDRSSQWHVAFEAFQKQFNTIWIWNVESQGFAMSNLNNHGKQFLACCYIIHLDCGAV